MSVLHITKENFEQEVLQSSMPVLVDLWASWCGPCRMLAPIIEELAEEYAHSVKFGKINVDEEPELATQFRVSSIPMLALVKNGKVVNTLVGYRPKAQIEEMLK